MSAEKGIGVEKEYEGERWEVFAMEDLVTHQCQPLAICETEQHAEDVAFALRICASWDARDAAEWRRMYELGLKVVSEGNAILMGNNLQEAQQVVIVDLLEPKKEKSS